MMIRIAFLTLLLSSMGSIAQEPSEFHAFVGKTGISVEARILSISEDRSMLKLEGRDGKVFESKVTGLSLDDQQFVGRWIKGEAFEPESEPVIKGKIRAFGVLPKEQTYPEDYVSEQDDFIAIGAAKFGWHGLRENGEMMTYYGRNNGMEVSYMGTNGPWNVFVKEDGTVWSGADRQAYRKDLKDVVQAVNGSNHHAVRFRDGTVKVWGRAYDNPDAPIPPPEPLSDIVDLASTQGKIAAIDSEGVIYCWDMKEKVMKSAKLGDGIVDIDGSIFNFIGLSRSGEIFVWRGFDPEKAKKPDIGGKALAVRAGGMTQAAKREDGTWHAWTKDKFGVADKINSLGVVPDIAFFTEPGAGKVGYVAWIEP